MLVVMIRVSPLLVAGLLAAFLGYHLTERVPAIGGIYQWLVLLGLFLGIIILEKEPGWNVVLYLGFALAAGALLCWSGALTGQVKSWVLFSALFLISLTGGAFSSSGIERVAVILFPVMLFYMSGWVFFLLFPQPAIYSRIWTILGLLLFTLIAAAVLSRGKTLSHEESAVPLVIQLFVALFNLCWLSGLIWL